MSDEHQKLRQQADMRWRLLSVALDTAVLSLLQRILKRRCCCKRNLTGLLDGCTKEQLEQMAGRYAIVLDDKQRQVGIKCICVRFRADV